MQTSFHMLGRSQSPGRPPSLPQELPAANANTLRLILEMCRFISLEAAVNEMDALALAQVFAPLLLWRQAPSPQPAPAATPLAISLVSKYLPLTSKGPTSGAQGGDADDAHVSAHGSSDQMDASSANGADSRAHAQVIDRQDVAYPLQGSDMQAAVIVIEHMVNNFTSVVC